MRYGRLLTLYGSLALAVLPTPASEGGARRPDALVDPGVVTESSAQQARRDDAIHPQSFVRQGVKLEYSALPTDPTLAVMPTAGEAARIRFKITDTVTGQPLTGLHPAAWLSRRGTPQAGARPQTAEEKVQELLGGSIFSQPDLDLNTFRVLALNDDATITVVDPLFGFGGTRLLALIPLPGVGRDWTLTPDDKHLLVSVPAAGKLAVIDTADWKVSNVLAVGSSPGRVAVQPDGHYGWVSVEGASAGVAIIAGDGSAVVASFVTGRGPHEVVFTADSRWAFVVNRPDHSLSVIDVPRLTQVAQVALGFRPAAAAFSPLSQALYLTDEAGGAVVVVDAEKRRVVARIAAEPGVAELKFAPGGRYGLIANPTRDRVHILDAATNRIIQTAQVDHAPEQFGFSSDLAYVRRRDSASVGMIPLKEIGHEGQGVPVAEFTGGEKAFGPPSSLADSIVAAPGETAVVVANAQDKSIYYYMEGMAAPMGNFGDYGRSPRAALVVDRSLRETSRGVYETSAVLPAAGDYDAVFFLDSPRLAHCFVAQVPPNPARSDFVANSGVRLEAAAVQKLVAGVPAQVAFRLNWGGDFRRGSVALPSDLTVMAMLAPGRWHLSRSVVLATDGSGTFDFTPPRGGVYYFYAASPSIGLALNGAPCLVIQATAPTAAPSP